MTVDLEKLAIVHYPHPVLRQRCAPVERFDEDLRAFVEKMYEVMREGRGVGLAAPQVNVPIRLFVMNATGEPEDNRVYINPVISDQHGSVEGEEGCLSLPAINVNVRRAAECRIVAQDLQGRPIEEQATELVARIMQHETDHLNGVLIIDRMGPTDKIATRKSLKALEEAYRG